MGGLRRKIKALSTLVALGVDRALFFGTLSHMQEMSADLVGSYKVGIHTAG